LGHREWGKASSTLRKPCKNGSPGGYFGQLHGLIKPDCQTAKGGTKP